MLQTCILMVYFFFIIPCPSSSLLILFSPRINRFYHLVPFSNIASSPSLFSFTFILSSIKLYRNSFRLFLTSFFVNLILSPYSFLFFSFGLIVNDLNLLKIYYLLFLFSIQLLVHLLRLPTTLSISGS